jgi:hypothetical protein
MRPLSGAPSPSHVTATTVWLCRSAAGRCHAPGPATGTSRIVPVPPHLQPARGPHNDSRRATTDPHLEAGPPPRTEIQSQIAARAGTGAARREEGRGCAGAAGSRGGDAGLDEGGGGGAGHVGGVGDAAGEEGGVGEGGGGVDGAGGAAARVGHDADELPGREH